MENDKEQWTEDVLNSMQGHQKIHPSSKLFSKIERGIHKKDAQLISLPIRRFAAAAAVALIILNAWSVSIYLQKQHKGQEESISIASPKSPLLSDFNLYE